MNAVEIEIAISNLVAKPFDSKEFPYEFLGAFGNKETTLKRLRKGDTNKSDCGGLLQANNIHIAVAKSGEVSQMMKVLRQSGATSKAKAKFILATDGLEFQAEDITADDAPIICSYEDFPNHFGFFLPLAGISTVKQIRESSFDIRATSRLNRLYVELLKDNPDWGVADKTHEMNHFMARLIFCFFAEDTDIFGGDRLFTTTVERMSERDSSNTHDVISTIFKTLNTKNSERVAQGLPRWTEPFPYVNGGLFSGNVNVPRFSKISRSYLLHIGGLDWTKINPDIFGSMIQAVADDEERDSLGMHYTSVPNILKVLNPLFLDDLRGQLNEVGNNSRALLNLRKRISKIRIFDPACGSGNFLVIAYKQMREIENEINNRRGEIGIKSDIPLTNFRGIELRDFPAEIARLALIIAEYQCDVLYRGQKEALSEFLPLDSQNWIVCGNALRLDWLSLCPPLGTNVKVIGDDLFDTPLDQVEIEFQNEGGETYICGNPPYKGSQTQTEEQKSDLKAVFERYTTTWKSLDYVSGWFMKAVEYGNYTDSVSAFVSTNSICQGRQVENLWTILFGAGYAISFAYTSFKWANLASHNAGVTVAIIGLAKQNRRIKRLYTTTPSGEILTAEVQNINAYLVPGPNINVLPIAKPANNLPEMFFGNMPNDGGGLLLEMDEALDATTKFSVDQWLIRRFVGSQEFIRGQVRNCIWVTDSDIALAESNEWLKKRFTGVSAVREGSNRKTTNDLASVPYRFGEVRQRGDETVIIVPAVSSETRPYLPVGYLPRGSIVSNSAFAIFNAPLWCLSIIASRLHLIWVGAVCGKLKTDFRYSNTLGWNTFPVPLLTEKNKFDLTKCAEDILLSRERHFPKTVADLYDPEEMPADLRLAHSNNDEVLERIYIGRLFKNDTERLEKLFELYRKQSSR